MRVYVTALARIAPKRSRKGIALKRFTYLALGIVLSLTACSGSSGGGIFGGNTPPPNIANTTNPYYLPLSPGNSWTFQNGVVINDVATGTFSCQCPGNNAPIEQLDAQDSSGTYIASLYFSRQNNLTTLIGIATVQGGSISTTSTTTYPDGIPVMDDNPTAGETWGPDEYGDTSTITAVGQTVTLGNGQQAVNVATDSLTVQGIPQATLTWQFAQGIGFVSLSSNTYGNTTLNTFSVSGTNSFAKLRRSTLSEAHRVFRAGSAMRGSQLAAFLQRFFAGAKKK